MHIHCFRYLFATIVLTLSLSKAHAAKFANQFIEFELPQNWECKLENAEWICQNTNEDKKREAIIVMAAKLRGDSDTMPMYLEHLKAPKYYNSSQGQQVKSEPKYAKETNINDQPWVDSLHMESEIPSFFTRYLATIKEDIGVLVTYSIHQDKYQEYVTELDKVITSLRVFRKPGGLNGGDAQANLFEQIEIPQGVVGDSVFPKTVQTEVVPQKAPAKTDDDTMMLLLVVGAAVAFFIWKKKSGK